MQTHIDHTAPTAAQTVDLIRQAADLDYTIRIRPRLYAYGLWPDGRPERHQMDFKVTVLDNEHLQDVTEDLRDIADRVRLWFMTAPELELLTALEMLGPRHVVTRQARHADARVAVWRCGRTISMPRRAP
jgi:hypothetical protein